MPQISAAEETRFFAQYGNVPHHRAAYAAYRKAQIDYKAGKVKAPVFIAALREFNAVTRSLKKVTPINPGARRGRR